MPRWKGRVGGGALADLPAETESVAEDAFKGCAHVTGIRVAKENEHLAAQGGVLYTRDLAEALAAPAGIGEAVSISPEAKRIGAKAFAGCERLASIVALGSVEDIAADAFAEATREKAVVALAAGSDYDAREAVWQSAGFQHFAKQAEPGASLRPDGEAGASGTPGETDANGSAAGDPGASSSSGFIYRMLDDYTLEVSWEGEEGPAGDFAIPASAKVGGVAYSVTAVAPHAFANRASIASATLPASIERVGEGAFEGCSALKDVLLPEGLASIGEGAFAGTALVRVTLPSTLRDLSGARAFGDCAALERVLALSNDLHVAADALAGCQGAVVWCPWNADGQSPWDSAVADGRNSVVRYGLSLAADPLRLEVGQEADLFDGGVREIPDGAELSYSYAAMPISVDAGVVSGKKPGTSEVAAALSLEGRELARATRTVEVVPASEEPQAPEEGGSEEGAEGDVPGDAPATDEPTGDDPAPDAEDPEAPAEGEDAEQNQDEAATAEPAEPVVPDHAILRATAQLSAEPLATAEITPYAAGDTFVSGYYTYTMLANGTVSIGHASTSAPNSTTFITLPSSVSYGGKSYSVSAVTARGFAGNTGLRKVKLPSSIKTIGDEAFKGATLLTACNMSATSITAVPNGCFMDCPKLAWSDTKFPSTLTSIGSNAFRNCTTLRQVVLPASVTQVGSYAYAGCTYLGKDVSATETRYVKFPSVKRIEEGTFQGCTGMQWNRVKLAANLEYIGPRAFEGCSGMGGIGTGIGSYKLPDTLTYIGPYAFANCTSAVNVILPSSITRIEDGTFQGCTKLSWNGVDGSVGFRTEGAISYIGNNAFKGCTNIKGTVDFYRGGKVSLASNVTIGNAAFERTGIVTLDLPTSVKSVGTWAFKDCASLTTASLSPGMTALPDEVFYGCSKLKSVTYMNNIATIGNSAFKLCSSLASIDISDKVTALGNAAFSDCTSLATVNGMNNVTVIGGSTFSNCTSLTSFEAPVKLTTIGSYAFNGCSNISKVILGPSVNRVEDNVFRGCTKLANVLSLGASAPSGGNSPFTGISPTVYCPKGAVAGWGTKASNVKPITVTASTSELKFIYKGTNIITEVTATDNLSGFSSIVTSVSRTAPDPKVATYTSSSIGSAGVKGGYGPVNIGTTSVKFSLNCIYRGVAINNVAETSFTIKVEGYTYKIVYKANGGSGADYTQNFTYGQAQNIKSFSECGFTWLGCTSTWWSTTPRDDNGTPYSPGQSLNADPGPGATITLYARWRYIQYNLNYNGNGANGGTAPANLLKRNYNQEVTLSPCSWTKTGYTFTGWNTDPNGKGSTYSPNQVVSKLSATEGATVTLYAQWQEITYKVDVSKYSDFGGAEVTGNYPSHATSATYNGTLTMPQNGFAKTGHTFVGWSVRSNLTGTTYKAGATVKIADIVKETPDINTNKTITLRPVWEPVKFTVYFDGWYAYDPNYDNTLRRIIWNNISYGQEVTMPANPFINVGHKFTGWTVGEPTPAKQHYQPGQKININVTPSGGQVWFETSWEAISYKVSFDLNGGTGNTPSQISTKYNTNITLPSGGSLSRYGYTFGGWNTQADGKGTNYNADQAYQNLSSSDNATVKLYAKWVPKQYKVYFVKGFEAASGASPAVLTTNYDATLTMPANPFSLSGYHFIGWNPRSELGGTDWASGASVKVADILKEQPEADRRGGDIYLHANFKPNKYVITVDGNYPTSGVWRDTIEAEYDRDVTIPQFPPASECWKTGYTAAGWNCFHADGSKSYHQPGEVVKKANFGTGDPGEPKDSVWLFLDWKANPYKIRFDANAPEGATPKGSMADLDMTFDTAKNLTKNAFTCEAEGKRIAFMGWNTKADGTGEAYADEAEAKNLASDKGAVATLYAQWKEVVVIDVEAPVKPLIGVDVYTGNIRTAAASFTSRSVADVHMTTAACEAGPGAERVFPEGSENVELIIADGHGNDLALKLGQAKELPAAAAPQFKIAKGSTASPSTLAVEFGLHLPEGVTWKPQDGPQDFASTVFTFAVA